MHKDQRYILALKNRDERVITEIYDLHFEKIKKMILSNSGNESDAKDIFQESLIALFDLATKKEFVLTCPLGAFLHRICKNKWIDKIRKKKVKQEVSFEDHFRYGGEEESGLIVMVEEAEKENQIFNQLERAFQQLSETCQELLRKVRENFSAQEIAKDLGMDQMNTFYRRKNACIQRMKKILETA